MPGARGITKAGTEPGLDLDRSVVVEGPVWVVGNLPHVTIGIGKRPCRAAPISAARRTNNAATGPLCILEQRLDLFGGTNVMRQLNAGSPVPAERRPETEDHPASLEETDLVIGLICSRPSKRLIEAARPGQVADAESHTADALFHAKSISQGRIALRSHQLVRSALSRSLDMWRGCSRGGLRRCW